jgi:hypothetical protein
MPLVDVIGVDNMGKTFAVAYAFLNSEVEENYLTIVRKISTLYKAGVFPSVIGTDCELALTRAIDVTFPAIQTKRVLCLWHISKNLMVNCKGKFSTMERWEEFSCAFAAVVSASSDFQYVDMLEEFKDEFHWNNGSLWSVDSATPSPEALSESSTKNLEREAVGYALGQWLIPYHQYFVRAWVDQFFNCGLSTTSRLEGAHHILKGWIGPPTKDLTRVWASIQLALTSQFNEIFAKKAQQAQGVPITLSGQFYYQIIGKISHHGLFKLYTQYLLFQDHLQKNDMAKYPCTGSWKRSMGMPCWHMIWERTTANQSEYSARSLTFLY